MSKKGKNLKERLTEFAKKHNLVKAITKGIDPEKGIEVYYFIVKSPYDRHLENEITNLEVKLYKDKYECNLGSWPCQNEISNYILENPFLGNIFWERD